MKATARTSLVLSPLPDCTPSELKALVSLATAIRADQRVRQAEAELCATNPRLLTDIEAGAIPSFARPRIVN